MSILDPVHKFSEMDSLRQEAKQNDGAIHTVIFSDPRVFNEKFSMTLHVRSMRKRILGELKFLLDPLFVAISDVPLIEDARVVRVLIFRGCKQDELTSPKDDFIKLYHQILVEEAPSIIDNFLK